MGVEMKFVLACPEKFLPCINPNRENPALGRCVVEAAGSIIVCPLLVRYVGRTVGFGDGDNIWIEVNGRAFLVRQDLEKDGRSIYEIGNGRILTTWEIEGDNWQEKLLDKINQEARQTTRGWWRRLLPVCRGRGGGGKASR